MALNSFDNDKTSSSKYFGLRTNSSAILKRFLTE